MISALAYSKIRANVHSIPVPSYKRVENPKNVTERKWNRIADSAAAYVSKQSNN